MKWSGKNRLTSLVNYKVPKQQEPKTHGNGSCPPSVTAKLEGGLSTTLSSTATLTPCATFPSELNSNTRSLDRLWRGRQDAGERRAEHRRRNDRLGSRTFVRDLWCMYSDQPIPDYLPLPQVPKTYKELTRNPVQNYTNRSVLLTLRPAENHAGTQN